MREEEAEWNLKNAPDAMLSYTALANARNSHGDRWVIESTVKLCASNLKWVSLVVPFMLHTLLLMHYVQLSHSGAQPRITSGDSSFIARLAVIEVMRHLPSFASRRASQPSEKLDTAICVDLEASRNVIQPLALKSALRDSKKASNGYARLLHVCGVAQKRITEASRAPTVVIAYYSVGKLHGFVPFLMDIDWEAALVVDSAHLAMSNTYPSRPPWFNSEVTLPYYHDDVDEVIRRLNSQRTRLSSGIITRRAVKAEVQAYVEERSLMRECISF